MDAAARVQLMNNLWRGATPLAPGDLAHRYLSGRVALPPELPSCLRSTDRCPAPDGIHRPALLALVSDPDGDPASIHRTFLGSDGKAEMDNPRALMPGTLPDGAAIRLFPVSGETLALPKA